MATTLTAALVLTYGESVPSTNVPCRQNLSFALTYTEESSKTVHVPPSSTDYPISLDTVTAPKFLFARSLDVDVTVKLSDGVLSAPSALSASGGWIMLANPSGQTVNELLVTTPASPAGGAHIQVIAFE